MESDRNLWPFTPRASIFATVGMLFGLLLLFAVLRVSTGWPSERSEGVVLGGVLLVSLLPVILVLLDNVMQRGGVIEVRGVKLDFTRMRAVGTSGVTVPVNVGVRGEPVSDSGTTEILESLRQAMSSDIVVIDLEEGQAWWETRLLVLLAGAERIGRPKMVAFVGTEGGKPQRFQGWGYADELLRALSRVDPQYQRSLQRARAAGRQWELVEPAPLDNPQDPPAVPTTPAWITGDLATAYSWMAFDNTGAKHELFVEQVLASELGNRIESPEGAREVTLVRLEELFRSVLHRESIDQTWSDGRQIENFFESEDEYLALTRRGRYDGLVSRLIVLNEFVRSLVTEVNE